MEVAHGNLVYARHPVVVGHYQGDTIISAEQALNERLDNRLVTRRHLDLYPGPIGTCEVFLNAPGKFPGAVVIGLGRVGELIAGKLTETFMRGVLEYALNRWDEEDRDDQDEPLTLQLSTLLIGTTAGGLPIRDSLVSLLRGVANANREMMRRGVRAHVAHLEILELWEDRAIQAAKRLEEFAHDSEFGRFFRLHPRIRPLRGQRKRAHYEDQGGWWERLQIAGGERGELRFTRLTDRARAEVSLLPTQRGLVERYIDQATAETVFRPDIARTLFELLVPNEIKDRVPDERDTIPVVDDLAAQYPWELLEDGLVRDRAGDFIGRDSQNAGDGLRPLSVRAGLVRQRLSDTYRAEPRVSMSNVALVVGNPPLAWADAFADLPGARSEAEAVANSLRKSRNARGMFDVVEVIEKTADDIVNRLFERPYRIVHLAGHGVHNFVVQGDSELSGWIEAPGQSGRRFHVDEQSDEVRQDPWFRIEYAPGAAGASPFRFRQGELVSGMVIGRNVFLTPREIRQMRAVPELVFINCCFCAKDKAPPRDRSQLAASIATQLIEMGVKAVIAAGWAVEDNAAKLFATTFYDKILNGAPFGRAVHAARSEVYRQHGAQVNTWGAYQCYGDPDYTLNGDGPRGNGEGEIRWSSEGEAIAAIDNLYQNALTARSENIDWLKKRLENVAKAARAEWPKAGAIQSALGRAYGELDMFKEAIESYTTAVSVERADVELGTLEQLANLMARHVEADAKKLDPKDPTSAQRFDDCEARITAADALIEKLIELGSLAQSTEGEKTRDPTANGGAETKQELLTTKERLTLHGSAAYRRAMIAAARGDRKKADAALKAMAYRYRAARDKDGSTPTTYPIVQEALADSLSGQYYRDSVARSEMLDRIKLVQSDAELKQEDDREFGTRAGIADCMLARALIEGTLAEQSNAIIRTYREAQERGASLREWRSVLETIDFVRRLARIMWSKGQYEPIMEPLGHLYRSLESFVDASRATRSNGIGGRA